MTRIAAPPLPHILPVEWTGMATIPARELLVKTGNPVVAVLGDPTVHVRIIRPPKGLVLVRVGPSNQDLALRLESEEPYPTEYPAASIPWWDRGEWTPCPRCGCGLLWCEAGFVPGWRVCLAGHAVQLSGDGRSAEAHPDQDRSTLAATKGL